MPDKDIMILKCFKLFVFHYALYCYFIASVIAPYFYIKYLYIKYILNDRLFWWL